MPLRAEHNVKFVDYDPQTSLAIMSASMTSFVYIWVPRFGVRTENNL